jgi:2-dehydro-3-deoxygalactonokinase
MTAPAADWIAVDWGTTNLRAWAMAEDGSTRAEAASAEGMGALSPEGYEPALLRLVAGWLRPGGVTPVLVAGMAGSRQGWVEAAYRAVPCPPVAPGVLTPVATRDRRLAVALVPGLKQAVPPDVMRGEEVQVAGVLAREPGFDGIVCLPGTHSKWVHVSAGEVVAFQTFLTGELFALLSRQSVLRHGLAGEGWDDAAFRGGLDDALARPERLAAHLFGLRAAHLLEGLAPAAGRARLSGLLIGAELAAARPWWLGRRVIVTGADGVAAAYRAALAAQGVAAETVAAAGATRAGLSLLRDAMVLACPAR